MNTVVLELSDKAVADLHAVQLQAARGVEGCAWARKITR